MEGKEREEQGLQLLQKTINTKMITKHVSPISVVYSYSKEVKKLQFLIDVLCLGQVNEVMNFKNVPQKYCLARENRI